MPNSRQGRIPPLRQTTLASINEIETPTNRLRTNKRTIVQTATSHSKFAAHCANDKSLSTYAHNVKVITQNGQVTLKGPVRSDEEKRAIEAKAIAIAGENKVTSELDIKPKN